MIRQEAAEVWPHLLFTPFLPLRSFLYCSLSLEIRLWSTSQASVIAFGSFSTWRMETAFSLRAQTPELEAPGSVYTSNQLHILFSNVLDVESLRQEIHSEETMDDKTVYLGT